MGRVVVAGVCPSSISGLPVAVSNGFADLGPGTGTDGGVIGIACTGASPRSGSNLVPGQVVTELLADRTYLRIIRTTGATIIGTVAINCTVDIAVASDAEDTSERIAARACASVFRRSTRNATVETSRIDHPGGPSPPSAP